MDDNGSAINMSKLLTLSKVVYINSSSASLKI